MTEVQDRYRLVSSGFDAAVTGDADALAKELDGPVGKMPAGEIIGRFVTMDLLVHTWDLPDHEPVLT
jgi:hypothetical protein